MSPRTEEQYEEIRKQKRELIMNAALEEFAEHGYHATSINMITKRAGVSKGLLYNYFDSKEELLKEIIKKAHNDVWVFFDPNHDGILTKDEFFYFIKQNMKVVRENVPFWRLFSVILLKPNVAQILEGTYIDDANTYMEMLYDFFKRNKCENPKEELLIFSSLLKGVMMLFIGNPLHIPLEEYENAVINYYTKKFEQNK
jgi:AcrR family transcriptional regulator